MPSAGRRLCFQHALLDGWDLASPIRALAQCSTRAVALPCSPAPQRRLPPFAPLRRHGSSKVRIVLPALYLGAITMRKLTFTFHTRSPPHKEGQIRISVQHHIERMRKDCWFLPGWWAATSKQHLKMEGASNTPSADSKQTTLGRQGDACLDWQ